MYHHIYVADELGGLYLLSTGSLTLEYVVKQYIVAGKTADQNHLPLGRKIV